MEYDIFDFGDIKDKQVILVVQDGCPYCEKAKEDLKPDIQAGIIKIVEINDVNAIPILTTLDITKVPACVIEDTKTGRYEYCSADEQKKQQD